MFCCINTLKRLFHNWRKLCWSYKLVIIVLTTKEIVKVLITARADDESLIELYINDYALESIQGFIVLLCYIHLTVILFTKFSFHRIGTSLYWYLPLMAITTSWWLLNINLTNLFVLKTIKGAKKIMSQYSSRYIQTPLLSLSSCLIFCFLTLYD